MTATPPEQFPAEPPFGQADISRKNKIILFVSLFGLAFIILVALLVHFFGGFGNPFVGTWKIDPSSNLIVSVFTLGMSENIRVTFTENTMVTTFGAEKESHPVSFRKQNDQWYVTVSGDESRISVIDKNRIVIQGSSPLANLTLVRAD
ncbi:MAG: hypothetical protein LBJ61_10880 [Deltaproteobacteria bacterium]|jgi:hypothetical protein|nr:hypothetical protein [Deltaproteobacteria bacterium]